MSSLVRCKAPSSPGGEASHVVGGVGPLVVVAVPLQDDVHSVPLEQRLKRLLLLVPGGVHNTG